jgi:hypothetical protein
MCHTLLIVYYELNTKQLCTVQGYLLWNALRVKTSQLMFNRPRRRRQVSDAPAAQDVLPDDMERLSRLVIDARAKLVPVAEMKQPGKTKYHLVNLPKNGYQKLGGEHGIGILLRVGNVALDTRGRVASEHELHRFLDSLTELREDVVQCFNTWMVLFALMLTVTIVLQFAPPPEGLDGEDDATAVGSAFGPDAAAWLSPSGNAPAVRRALYCVECGLLAVAVGGSMAGLVMSLIMGIMLAALPTPLAFLEFVLDQFSSIMFFYMCGDLVLMGPAVMTPFIAARSSGVAFCASLFVPAFGCFFIWAKATMVHAATCFPLHIAPSSHPDLYIRRCSNPPTASSLQRLLPPSRGRRGSSGCTISRRCWYRSRRRVSRGLARR